MRCWSRWHEVWSFGSLDELPSEGFEGDVVAGSEFAQEVRCGSVWEAAGDVLEHHGRDDADLQGDDIVHGQADHEATRIVVPDELRKGGGQERIVQKLGRLVPERDGRLPGSVAAQGHRVALIERVQQRLADRSPGSLRDRLSPGIPVTRNPGEIGFHSLILHRRGVRFG
jgi:hypothetical protein